MSVFMPAAEAAAIVSVTVSRFIATISASNSAAPAWPGGNTWKSQQASSIAGTACWASNPTICSTWAGSDKGSLITRVNTAGPPKQREQKPLLIPISLAKAPTACKTAGKNSAGLVGSELNSIDLNMVKTGKPFLSGKISPIRTSPAPTSKTSLRVNVGMRKSPGG